MVLLSMMNTTWTREKITDLLNKSDKAVERLLIKLFERQTATEKERSRTVRLNARGFTMADAPRLTHYAKILVRGGKLETYQMEFCRSTNARGQHCLAKYSRQIVELIGEKQEAVK